MTNILYFHHMVRASDSSSVDESIDESEPAPPVEGNFDELEANSIQRSQPRAKGRVLSVIEKACFGVVKTVSFVARSGLETERGGSNQVEKKQGDPFGESPRTTVVSGIGGNNFVSSEYIMLARPVIWKSDNESHRELAVAGWPDWLIYYAGKALDGWTPRHEDSFEKLKEIGEGPDSIMYKARDISTGKIVVLKKAQFVFEPENIEVVAREIIILRQLDHPNVLKLEGVVTSRMSSDLYLIFEYMEGDLTWLTGHPGIKFTVPQVKCYMHQLLSGIEHCHSRGVFHRNITGRSLLLDSQGILKIAGFGALLGADHEKSMTGGGDAVTILCRNEVEQLQNIFKLFSSSSEGQWGKLRSPQSAILKLLPPFKEYSPPMSLETLLGKHQTASAALQSKFFTSEPRACESSSLPPYHKQLYPL